MAKQTKEKKGIKDLEQLLSQLTSDSAKHELVYELVCKGKAVPVKYIRDAINYRADNFGHGQNSIADFCFDPNLRISIKNSAEILKIRKQTLERLEKSARDKKSNKKSDEHYHYTAIFEEAAQLAEKMKMYEKAIQLYNAGEHFDLSAEVASKQGKFEEAIRYFIRVEKYEEAASICEKIGNHKKAEQLYARVIKDYEENGDFYDAIDFAEKIGWSEKAKELKINHLNYRIKNKQYECAAKIAEETRNSELAIKLYLKTKKFDDAFRIAEKEGTIKELIDISLTRFPKGNVYHTSIFETLENQRLPLDITHYIIELREKEGDFEEAAETAFYAGLEEEAKELYARVAKGYEERCLFDDAAKAAEKAGLKDKARLYRRIGKLTS